MKTRRAVLGSASRFARPSAGIAPTLVGLLAFACWAGCGAQGDKNNTIVTTGNGAPTLSGPASSSGSNTAGGGMFVASTCTGPACDLAGGDMSLPAPPGCGDGVLAKDEACDDGNTVSGDGCAANCLATEP